jgi:hypothetical protein
VNGRCLGEADVRMRVWNGIKTFRDARERLPSSLGGKGALGESMPFPSPQPMERNKRAEYMLKTRKYRIAMDICPPYSNQCWDSDERNGRTDEGSEQHHGESFWTPRWIPPSHPSPGIFFNTPTPLRSLAFLLFLLSSSFFPFCYYTLYRFRIHARRYSNQGLV